MRRLVLALTLIAGTLLTAHSGTAASAPEKTFFYIPAADGTPLRACAIASPGALQDTNHHHPVILEWTSYAIDADFGGYFPSGCPPQFAVLATRAAEQGYVYVAANTRGTGASGGDFQDVWDRADALDGAHVVEWLAAQPWSSGKVGVVGCSNSGAFANGLAAVAPKHLRAVLTDCSPLDPYRDTFYPGGLASYSLLFTSSRPVASQVTPQAAQEWAARGDTSPLLRGVKSTQGQADIATHQSYDASWSSRDLTADAPFRVPTYYLGSWQDYMLRGTTEYARLMGKRDRVLITPGEHGSGYSQLTGSYSFTERALGWMGHWLRGLPDPFASESRILYYELDGGLSPIPTGQSPAVSLDPSRVRGAAQWPLPEATYQRWYFTPTTSGSSHSLNDLGLSTSKPAAESTANWAYPGASTASFDEPRQPGGDETPSSGSDDGDAVTFTSSPMAAPLHVAGPVTVSFDAQSTATETDFVVRLIDVAPDGSAHNVTEGWLKSSFRALDVRRTLYDADHDIIRPFHDHSTAVPLTPLATEHYDVELLATANEFPTGHRLRVVVTSTATPWSLQTIAPAVNTTRYGGTHLSDVLLPVVS